MAGERAAPGSARPGAVVAGRYQLLELAGEGSTGTVWRARDSVGGTQLALKHLRAGAGAAERLGREARALASLRHPGIVRYVDHGIAEDGRLYIAMEWLEGEDLSRHLSRHRRLDLREAVDLIRRVARALGAAHRAGVTHRDLKPANVFLVGGRLDRPKILDFGVAQAADASLHERPGRTVGTVGYLAPEQVGAHGPVSPSADVFSLGCLLYHCLVGRPPFVAPSAVAALAKVLLEDPPPLEALVEGTPPGLSTLVGRMLAKEADDRPADGLIVAEELTVAVEPRRARPSSLHVDAIGLRTVLRVASSALGQDRLSALAAEVLGQDRHRVEDRDGALQITPTGGDPIARARRAARLGLELSRLDSTAAAFLETIGGARGGAAPVRAGTLLCDGATLQLLGTTFATRPGPDGSAYEVIAERLVSPVARSFTPFTGRRTELSALATRARRVARERQATATLVVGEPGVGKTRLVTEALRALGTAGQDFSLWLCRGDPLRAHVPWGLAADGLRRSVDLAGGERAEDTRAALEGPVSDLLPAHDVERVRDFLSVIVGIPPPDAASARMAAARTDPARMQEETQRAVIDVARALAERSLLVIVLDDLQWGDAASVTLFGAVLRASSSHPILVVGTAHPTIDQRHPRLWDDLGLDRIHLAPLEDAESRTLARSLLGDSSGAQLETVLSRAEGNPFVLTGLARAAAEGERDLPVDVRASLERRIERLDPDAQAVLRAASVFGQVFWPEGLRPLLQEDVAEELDAWLAILEEEGLVAPAEASRVAGATQWETYHRILTEVAYAMIPAEARRSAHAAVADWLEARTDREHAVVAEHAERGGRGAMAARAWVRAAEQALEAHDAATSLALAERALSHPLEGETLGQARSVQAAAHTWIGNAEGALRAARDALALLPRRSHRWHRSLGNLAISAFRRGDTRELLAWVGEVTDGLAAGEGEAAARAAATVAMALVLSGAEREGEQILSALEGRPDLVENRAIAGRIATVRAFLLNRRRDVSGYIAATEQAVRLLAGEEHNSDTRLNNLATGLRRVGRLSEAAEVFQTSLEAAERLRGGPRAATARQNLAITWFQLGRIEESIPLSRRAIAELAQSGARRLESWSRAHLARALRETGELEEAERQARGAIELSEGSLDVRPYPLAVLASVLLSAERLPEAEESSARAVESFEQIGWMEEHETYVLLVRAEVLWALGRQAEARTALADAAARVDEVSRRIGDPELRDAFASLPDNARVSALTERWRAG